MKSTIYLLALLTAFSAAFSQVPLYHSVKSTKGNIEVTVTNDGRIGYSPNLNESGFVWPRGSNAQYLYGGGFFLSNYPMQPAMGDLDFNLTYEPSTSETWYVPGSTDEGNLIRKDLAKKNRVYSSINYNKYSGSDLNDEANPKWPIWTNDGYLGTFYGKYQVNEDNRNQENRKVKIMADEDIVTIFKDTDTSKNISGEGYHVDAQTRVYNFENENQKNSIFVNWIITNKGENLLKKQLFAPFFDIDITKKTNRYSGIDNDVIIFPKDSSYVTFATEMGEYEKGESFGYITFKWVQLPDLVADFVEYDSVKDSVLDNYDYVQYDPKYSLEYFSMSYIDENFEIVSPTDQKVFMATKFFNLASNKSASFVLQINMTPPNEDYPIMDEATRSKIEAELAANEVFFNQRLTSVEVVEELIPISVFPNPTVDGKLSVELGLPIGEQMSIELFDLAGNTLGKLYQGMHHSQNYELNIGKRASGTYLLRFTVGEKTYSKKFVVGG